MNFKTKQPTDPHKKSYSLQVKMVQGDIDEFRRRCKDVGVKVHDMLRLFIKNVNNGSIKLY